MVAMPDSSKAALAVGRFAGWEPLGFEAGDENWYRFVANGPTGKTDPSGLQAPTKHKSDASPQAKELMEILPSVLDGLRNIAKGTTDTVERGGYILRVTKTDTYVAQECTNKKSGPVHFEQGVTFTADGKHFISRPGPDGIVTTDDPPAFNEANFDRRIAYSFHTHPPFGDAWASGEDCRSSEAQKRPDVMIKYDYINNIRVSGDVYYVWISDVDGKAFEYQRIDETKAKPRPTPILPK